jgi:hypothetical protein
VAVEVVVLLLVVKSREVKLFLVDLELVELYQTGLENLYWCRTEHPRGSGCLAGVYIRLNKYKGSAYFSS